MKGRDDSSTLGAVAGARAADRLNTTPQGMTDAQFADTSQTVRAKAHEMGLGSDVVAQGSRAARTASPKSDIDLAIRVSPEKFTEFVDTKSRLASPNPGSSLAKTRVYSLENGIVQRGEARLSSAGKTLEANLNMPVDLSVVRKGGNFDRSAEMALPSARQATTRAAGQGAAIGAAVEAGFGVTKAIADGRLTRDEAHDILTGTAKGAAVGSTYAVTEQGLVKLADRTAGKAIERGAVAAATRLGASEATTLGTASRVVGTRLAGAGAAGAVISAGMSIYENRDGLAKGDSQAIGRVVGDTVVGAGSALAGAAAGAAIGSIVPGVGTVVGAAVGLGAGFLADYAMRAGGVDKAISHAVEGGVDAVKGAASKVAGWLGW